jgi:glutathione S-transferase
MTPYQLYYAPGACSLTAHAALEWLAAQGLAGYTAHKLILGQGDQRRAEYLAINPRGKVPALMLADGTVLTETLAILRYLHAQHPQAGLLPADALREARGWEWLSWLSSAVQSHAFTLVFYPMRFVADEPAQAALEAHGRALLQQHWADLESRLPGEGFALGPRRESHGGNDGFSLVDVHLAVFYRWAKRYGFAPQRHYPRWAALVARTLQQPIAAATFAAEGVNLVDRLPPRPAHLQAIPDDAMEGAP